MEELSKLLLAIYRASRERDPAEFQETTLTLVRSVLAFDSCTWSICIVTPEQGMVFLSDYLFEEWPSRVEDYEGVRLQNSVPLPTIAQLGVMLNCHAPTLYADRAKATICAYSVRYHHQCILTMASPDPTTGGIRSVVFYRKDASMPFSEEERKLCQWLVPHLMEALAACYGGFLERLKVRESSHPCVALADHRGVMQYAGDGFSMLCALEWPGWDGIRLPSPLLGTPMPGGRAAFCGSSLVVQLRRLKDLVFLQAWPKLPVDNLTPRELVVAACVAEGLSYKDIAQRLHLAPTTVRNHIQAIHERLGIHSNIELAALLRRAPMDLTPYFRTH